MSPRTTLEVYGRRARRVKPHRGATRPRRRFDRCPARDAWPSTVPDRRAPRGRRRSRRSPARTRCRSSCPRIRAPANRVGTAAIWRQRCAPNPLGLRSARARQQNNDIATEPRGGAGRADSSCRRSATVRSNISPAGMTRPIPVTTPPSVRRRKPAPPPLCDDDYRHTVADGRHYCPASDRGPAPASCRLPATYLGAATERGFLI